MSRFTPANAAESSQLATDNAPWRMWAAAWIVIAIFILSNSASPLYVHWQTGIGFSSAMLTAIFAAYILGLLLTLLVAGQLSDSFGRRPVLLPGLAAAIIACLLFSVAQSVAVLLIARFLSGMAVGAAVSAGMASIVDLGGLERLRQTSLLASVSMVLGAGFGPLLAGSIALALDDPIVPIFVAELGILASALLTALVLPLRKGTSPAVGAWRASRRSHRGAQYRRIHPRRPHAAGDRLRHRLGWSDGRFCTLYRGSCGSCRRGQRLRKSYLSLAKDEP